MEYAQWHILKCDALDFVIPAYAGMTMFFGLSKSHSGKHQQFINLASAGPRDSLQLGTGIAACVSSEAQAAGHSAKTRAVQLAQRDSSI
jgi:hypothetical protein